MATHERIALSITLSLIFSVSLGVVFACMAFGGNPAVLVLPAVIPVMLLVSAVLAAIFTPLAFWTVRTGKRNLLTFGPAVWALLAAYIVIVIPRTGRGGPLGLLALAAAVLVAFGFVPPARSSAEPPVRPN